MNKLTSLLYPLLILLVFSLLYFTSLQKPVVIDYDEGVYAEVSRAMFANSEPVVPELNGEGFFEKPPMLYWAQMLGYQYFGISSLGARFVNALAAILTLSVFYFGAAGPLGRRTAFNATLILGSSIIFTYLSRVAMTDMLLTLFLTLCLIVSWYGVERFMKSTGGAHLFWLGCLFGGLAMLSKGAIGALFPIVTAIIYLISIGRPTIIFRKSWFFPGTAILIVVGFSWYLLLGFLHPEGFSFMRELFLEHHMGRFSSAMEGHSGSVFYYLIVLFVGFMPWFGYLPLSFFHMGLKIKDNPGNRYLRLFVIFSLVVFVFFSLAATKLPNYILPALPGFALLIAILFNRDEMKYPVAWRLGGWIAVVPMILLGLILAAAPLIYPYLAEFLGEDAYKTPALAESVSFGYSPYLAAFLFLLSAFLLIRAIRGTIAKLFETLLLCSFINSCTIFFLVIPLYDQLMDAPLARLAEQAALQSSANGKVIMYEIDDRPSVNFVSGLATIEHDERDYQLLSQQFNQSDITVGLSTVFYFERLLDLGVPAHEIARDTGFVLFHIPPAEPATER